KMKAMGLFGLLVPAEYGGAAADMVSFTIAFQEIARGWMGVAGTLGSHSITCWLIAHHGTEDQKERYLRALASGGRRTRLALTQPGAGTDLQGISTCAVRDGDYYVLTGTKMWVTNARHADPLAVLAKTDPTAEPRHRGMSMFLVDKGTPGFNVSRDLGKLG